MDGGRGEVGGGELEESRPGPHEPAALAIVGQLHRHEASPSTAGKP